MGAHPQLPGPNLLAQCGAREPFSTIQAAAFGLLSCPLLPCLPLTLLHPPSTFLSLPLTSNNLSIQVLWNKSPILESQGLPGSSTN